MLSLMNKGLTYLFTFFCLFMLLLTPALAVNFRSGGNIAIGKEEVLESELYVAGSSVIIDGTINDDVFAAGDTVIINGTIDGDLFVSGRKVEVNGIVKRSVMAVGQTVNIGGTIEHDVRAAGNTINISANINGDVTIAGGGVDITKAASVIGDLIFGVRNIQIDAPVDFDIVGGGGHVYINSDIKGDVQLKVEDLTLLPAANISGNLTYESKNEAEIQTGVLVAGNITHKTPEVKEREVFPFFIFFGIWASIIGFLMALLVGGIAILITPRWLTSLTQSIKSKPGPCAGWGAIVLFATPVAIIVSFVTIIGIPLGLIASALYGISIYLSQIIVGLFIGKWIIRYFRPETDNKAIMFGAFALGLVILRILRLIPFFGLLVMLVVVLFGIGSMVISLWKQKTSYAVSV